ncbi:PrsW family intramembrane metalloprotease [Candidatus Parcubacteria bacterium]|nr:PrsW family intramembrane metalloprotease [Candidatus Parcubacteria bacterium]
MSQEFLSIIYALLGGILPSLIWLFFWLEEDKKRPEPKGRLLITFALGMVAVVVVLPFQKITEDHFSYLGLPILLLMWATLEEVFKLGAGYFGGIHSRDDDEPVDTMIYMITAALGFVALENTLFILNPILPVEAANGIMIQKILSAGDIVNGVVTAYLRFIGASLLHVLSSATVGTAMALTYYKSKFVRIWTTVLSIIMAVAIHTSFNLFIVVDSQFGTFITFAGVWAGIIILMYMFEKVKGEKPVLQ